MNEYMCNRVSRFRQSTENDAIFQSWTGTGLFMYLILILFIYCFIHRGSYTSTHVLLNLLSELGERDQMRGLPSILSLFRNEFNNFNNTRARMLDSIYHMTLRLLWNLMSAVKTL